MMEIMNNKREFNAKVRELIGIGYRKTGEFGNRQRFKKHVFLEPDLEVTLIKGWKEG